MGRGSYQGGSTIIRVSVGGTQPERKSGSIGHADRKLLAEVELFGEGLDDAMTEFEAEVRRSGDRKLYAEIKAYHDELRQPSLSSEVDSLELRTSKEGGPVE